MEPELASNSGDPMAAVSVPRPWAQVERLVASVRPYGVAVMVVALMAGVRYLLDPVLGEHHPRSSCSSPPFSSPRGPTGGGPGRWPSYSGS